MNLIDNYDLEAAKSSFQMLKDLVQSVKSNLPCMASVLIDEASEAVKISVLLCKVNGNRLMGNITLTSDYVATMDSVLTDLSLFARCKSNFQTTTIIRYFMNQNSFKNSLIFKIHPISGVFSIGRSMSFPKDSNRRDMLEMLVDTLSSLGELLHKEYTKILAILNDSSVSPQKLQQETTKALKVYVQSSSHYTWKAQEGRNKGKHTDAKSTYQPKKKVFRKKRGPILTNSLLCGIQKAYMTTKTDLFPFFVLNSAEDIEIYEKYIQHTTGFKKNSTFICRVTAVQESQASIQDEQVFVAETKDFGRVRVLAQEKEQKHLEYERKILAVLKDNEFIGLPRYFQLENNPEVNSKFSLTNLYESVNFGKLLKSNKKSMSFQTKLALLTIIIRTLRYLRDCGVVYNNLRPNTIFVKKGLIPKLSDFTNAYHESVTPMQESFKDHFPYVSILKSFYRTYSFEKSDSMSFGALAFEAVFGKPIKYVRSSVSARLRAEERHQIIAKGEAFAIENCNQNGGQSIRVLIKMIMDSMKHKSPKEEFLDQTQDDSNGLEQRPYLDWYQIVLRKIQEQTISISTGV